MAKRRILAICAASFLLAAAAEAERYRIEPGQTRLVFSVPYVHGVLGEAVGEFREVEGEVLYETDDPAASEFVVRVRTASVETQFEARDVDLRGESFFASERYPEAVFRSHRIERSEEGFVAHGELELRGQVQPLSLRFDLRRLAEGEGERLWASGSTRLARSDFGIEGPGLVGEFVIGEYVNLRFNLVLVPAPD